MGRKANSLLPEVISNLKTMGEQIKQARLRRNLSCEVIAQRADISRSTLCEVEKGSPSVAIGTYAAVLNALNGMDTDLLLIAKEDLVGRKIQDHYLLKKMAQRTFFILSTQESILNTMNTVLPSIRN